MKRPSLLQGIGVAIALSAIGLSLLTILESSYYWSSLGFNMTLGTLAFLYILYLLSRARIKTGKFSLGVISAVLLGAAVVIGVPWLVMLGLAVGLIWVIRSLYSYSSLLGGLADAFLCVVSLGWAAGAYSFSGSLIWAIWCFFLAQTLFTLIPSDGFGGKNANDTAASNDPFARAHLAAEAAIRQLASKEGN